MGSIYTTIAVALERAVTVCAPFTHLKVIFHFHFYFYFHFDKYQYDKKEYCKVPILPKYFDNIVTNKIQEPGVKVQSFDYLLGAGGSCNMESGDNNSA